MSFNTDSVWLREKYVLTQVRLDTWDRDIIVKSVIIVIRHNNYDKKLYYNQDVIL